MFEKGKGAKVGKEASKQSRKRLAVTIDNSQEEQQQIQQQPQQQKSEKVEEKVTPKITRNTKIERSEPRINLEKINSLEKAPPRVDKPKLESPKVNRIEKPVKLVKPVTKEVAAGSDEDDTRSRSTEVKSEMSDQEGSLVGVTYSTVV